MKILLITLEYPPILGGVSTYLTNLYAEAEDDVTIIAPPTYTFYAWWCWPHWLPFYFQLKKIVQTHRPDEIHVSHVLPVGQMALWIFKKFKIPYVIIFHGTDLLAAQAQPKKWERVKRIVKHASRIVVNSQATLRMFNGLIPERTDASVVPPGVERLQPGASDILQRNNLTGKQYILFLARLVERKGLLVACEALYKLIVANVDIHLVVAGEGPLRMRAEERVRELNIADHITFVGKVTNEEKAQLYSGAHLFWFPAQPTRGEWEGFGITSLEAQSMGCPVIVSNSGGLPESMIDGESGFAVEPTAEAFADATRRILHDSALWQKLRLGARAVAQGRTWEKSRALFFRKS